MRIAPELFGRLAIESGEHTDDTVNIIRAAEALAVLAQSLRDAHGLRLGAEADPQTVRKHLLAFLAETVAGNRSHG